MYGGRAVSPAQVRPTGVNSRYGAPAVGAYGGGYGTPVRPGSMIAPASAMPATYNSYQQSLGSQAYQQRPGSQVYPPGRGQAPMVPSVQSYGGMIEEVVRPSSFGRNPMEQSAYGRNSNFPFYADPLGYDHGYSGQVSNERHDGPSHEPHLGGKGPSHDPHPAGSVTKIQVWIEGAKGLKSGDWFSKSDPYCICQFDKKKGFQTKVLNGVGPDPEWHHGPETLPYHNEAELEFLVYDKDVWPKPDDLLGRASLPKGHFLPNGYEGELALTDGKHAVPGSLRVRVMPFDGASAHDPHSNSGAHTAGAHTAAAHAGAHTAAAHAGAHTAPKGNHTRGISLEGSASTGSLSSQLQELLSGQRKMEDEIAQIKNQMQSNYQNCMGETEKIRRDFGTGHATSSGSPYDAFHSNANQGNPYAGHTAPSTNPAHSPAHSQFNSHSQAHADPKKSEAKKPSKPKKKSLFPCF